METSIDKTSPKQPNMTRNLTLTTLPEEILLQIFTYVSQSAKDIISVLVTSKQFYRISKPLVYITILLPARIGWEIFDSIDIRDRIKVLTSKIDSIARYIQDLGLCQAEPMLEIREDTEKRQISAELAPILAKIPPGHLRSFRWDIRAKCPEEILTNLHTHQLNLETLIIHYPSFDYISEKFIGNFTRKLKKLVKKQTFIFTLHAFQNLRHLCIYGDIASGEKQRLIIQLSTILKTLKTFVVAGLGRGHHFWRLQRRTDDSSYKKSKKSLETTYPCLETFASDDNGLASMLSADLHLDSISQFPNLRAFHSRFSLTSCLLSNFDPKVPIRLRTLEVQGCNITVLSNFLLAFQGLGDLDIMVSPDEDYLDSAPILHHAATLKRLALWKLVDPPGRGPMIMPTPFPLMKSLGVGLEQLEELCAALTQEYDPFQENHFPGLKLLWLYNNNLNPSYIDFAPEYPWIPPTNDKIKSSPQWTLKNSTLELDVTAYPNLTIPKNLKAVAIGHYSRAINLEVEANGRIMGNSKYTERLYERVEEGDKTVVWKRIGMRELAWKYPDLLSPYENAFGVPLMKRHYIFNSTEIDGVLDPSEALPNTSEEQ